MSSSDDALTASFLIAQLIAKKKKAHAEAEEIILPALKIAAGCCRIINENSFIIKNNC
jgi:ATP-dependent protease HslVU (ClpYQ) peptidase subunit